MRTAVDSSVLLDVLTADAEFGRGSRAALIDAVDRGVVVACDVVWAEVRAQFPDDASFEDALHLLGIEYDPLLPISATAAGARWQDYCRKTRRAHRSRVVADFLIGAHALLQADALLARDRGFWDDMWSGLQTIDPSARAS
ncbi:MAG: PIN domain-containing protein [Acidobacteriota bacterium]|nr:PIN domain-containing protein [Acidobacteriota bacterium]